MVTESMNQLAKIAYALSVFPCGTQRINLENKKEITVCKTNIVLVNFSNIDIPCVTESGNCSSY